MELSDAITSVQRDERRRAEVFRKGVVTAVVAGTPTLYTIDGARSMPVLTGQATLAVGDVVAWIDQADPVLLGKFAGT